MSEFSASIIARLDTSKIPGDIKNIEKKRIMLGNFALDTKKLPSQIQASLDGHKFKINIDGLKFGNIDAQMKKMGSSASRAFSQSFNVYKDLSDIQKRIGSLNLRMEKIGPSKNIAEYRTLQNQLDKLNGSYSKLVISSAGNLSDAHIKKLSNELDTIDSKIELLKAKLQDTSSSGKISSDFNTLYDTAKKIGSLRISIAKLDGEDNNNQIVELESQLSNLKKTYDALSSSLSGKLSTEQLEKLSSATKDTDSKIELLKAKLQDSAKPVNSLDIIKLQNNTADWLHKNTSAAKDFGQAIEGVLNKLHTLNSNGELTEVEFGKIKEEIENIKQEAIKAGKTGNTFSNTFSKAFRSILNYVSVSSVIYGAANGFKEMYRNVVEIDSAMSELKKVTNETDATYAKFLSNASSSAKEIGSTITGYINSTSYFARLGYSFGDSQELAKVANIYAVVGDEIKSNDEATKSLISTMTAFDVEADNSISIVDKFNEVGKHNVPKDTVMYWDISLLVAISAKIQ